MTLRDQIRAYTETAECKRAAAPVPVPTPELPQWDGQIFVCRVCARAVANCWKDTGEDTGQLDERARFAAAVACDAEGSRIFQDDDVLWLSCCASLGPMIERIYWAGRELNGLTEENRTGWRKNSAGMGGGGLPSSCAGPSQRDTASTPTGS